MKKGLKIFLSFLLSASVLISSTGVVIASHVCLKKGQADVSLFQSKSCCSTYRKSCESVPVVKKKCCQLTISYHKIELNSLVKSSALNQVISMPVMDAVISLPASFSFQKDFSFSDDPPGSLRLLPGSKNFLHSIHSLLI